MRIWLIATATLMGLSGCATMIMRDGFELLKENWVANEREIISRASFELSCAPDKLTLQVLADMQGANVASQVGVTGCDRKVVYVKPYGSGTWVMNSSNEAKK